MCGDALSAYIFDTNEKGNFFIDGIQLQESNSKRDIGVIFSSYLKWKFKVLTDGECNMKQLISE